jgi:xanthine dehydrogenase accessory factor
VKIFARAVELLAAEQPAAVATVIATSGSTPRHPGARMLVPAEGDALGTIGGGRVELEVTQAARAVARGAAPVRVTHHLVRDLAMCCGGSMEFFIQPVAPSAKAFTEAARALAERKALVLLTPFDGTPARIEPYRPAMGRRPSLQDEAFVEPLLPAPRLILFGVGHVTRAIGPLAHNLGFEVVLCDDGQTGAIDGPHPFAERVIPSFEYTDIERTLRDFGDHDFVVITTRDHALDERILEQFLPIADRLGYLGVIGSRGKLGRFHKRLQAKQPRGFEHWHRVHGPIGLDIGAETPDEIAVSLLAELIQLKNQKQSGTA